MPSANKTPNIELNQWQGNEYPKRQDFNNDNQIIDTKIKEIQDAQAAHEAEDASGNVHNLSYDYVHVQIGAAQSIPNNEDTLVAFTQFARRNSPKLNWSSSNPTKVIVGAGVSRIRITAGTAWDDNEVGKRMMGIKKNGNYLAIPSASVTSNAVDNISINNVSTQQYIHVQEIPVAENDYIELVVKQTSGDALSLNHAQRCTFMAIEVIKG